MQLAAEDDTDEVSDGPWPDQTNEMHLVLQ